MPKPDSAVTTASNRRGSTSPEEGAVEDDTVSTAEYNRWLYLEDNWDKAEDIRNQFMAGEQMRKERDEKHRNRGLERQAASIEQMKRAKGEVDQHRERNMTQGKEVREDVANWKEEMYANEEELKQRSRMMKEMVTTADKTQESKEALLQLKKTCSLNVKMEVMQLAKDNAAKKESLLESNRSMAAKIRSETSDHAMDSARHVFYQQRKKTHDETVSMIKDWASSRAEKKEKFKDFAAKRKEEVKTVESIARNSRKTLAEQRKQQAAEFRAHKKRLQAAANEARAKHASMVKQIVMASSYDKFVPPTESRRMLNHSHYAEVMAVVTDITSNISKEIAASPRRRLGSAAPSPKALTKK